jgi:hypothetical protein
MRIMSCFVMLTGMIGCGLAGQDATPTGTPQAQLSCPQHDVRALLTWQRTFNDENIAASHRRQLLDVDGPHSSFTVVRVTFWQVLRGTEYEGAGGCAEAIVTKPSSPATATKPALGMAAMAQISPPTQPLR